MVLKGVDQVIENIYSVGMVQTYFVSIFSTIDLSDDGSL